ncbi:MAG: alpha/beta hydrolase [Novosphingobium sp.]|nr:alpha/beta hydrolase [Novosphingobium sp.]
MTQTEEHLPEWFARAVAMVGESHTVEVEGCPIHYLTWGDPALPGLLFLGASGGHAHWYDHVAPLFASRFRVVVMDPAGCGDSGRREAYSKALVTAEIAGVLADSGLLAGPIPPVVVGHSAGAQCVVRAAQTHGGDWLGVIAVDGLRYAELETDSAIAHFRKVDPDAPPPPRRAPKVYETLEEATARFRLSPPPRIEIGNEFIVRHIGDHSYRQVEGGWTSKFDPGQTQQVIDLAFELTGALKDLPCRAASLYAEHSHLTDPSAGPTVTAMNDGKVTSFTIPGTSHFPMIDSPFAFVSAIEGVALTWLAEWHRLNA